MKHSNGSNRRQKRQQQRMQRLEQFALHGEIPEDVLNYKKPNAKKNNSPPHGEAGDRGNPHPYHVPPPPANQGLVHRSTSQNSHVSDISMDDFQGAHETMAHESVFEYSDTSDDQNDAYFLEPGSRARLPVLRYDSTGSGESAFRDLRSGGLGTKSSRAVRFDVSGKAHSFIHETPGVDEVHADDEDPDSSVLPKFHSPPPPPPGHGDNQHHNPTLKNWMTNLAYSFRSPVVKDKKNSTSPPGGGRRSHRPTQSSSIMEYPYTPSLIPYDHWSNHFSSSESHPLLSSDHKSNGPVYGVGHPPGAHPLKGGIDEKKSEHGESPLKSPHPPVKGGRSSGAVVSANFLMDYEAGRPPTLSKDFKSITPEQLKIYKIHFSWAWRHFGIHLAVLTLFMAHSHQDRLNTALMHTYGIVIFLCEIWMKETVYGKDHSRANSHMERVLVKPLVIFLCVLGVESWAWYILQPFPGTPVPTLVSAIFKPLVFFYVSQKARHALEALIRIGSIVVRVLCIEIFLILTFAAVACQIFHGFDSFASLTTSWLSLFELSTTVVNPSLWMPMYAAAPGNAIFFIFFIVVSVFYLHSLVLSVVFQTYIQAASEIHERSMEDREDAIRLAFLALVRHDHAEFVSTASVRKTMQIVRPHYSALKIKALMDIVDPTNQHIIDYPSFRTKVRQALNASVRTARSTSTFAMGVELIAVMVAVVNFIYVMLFTSAFQADWFDSATVSGGAAITLLGLLELVIRFNPLKIPNFAPITRLNAAFDGLALTASLVSIVGIVQYVAGIKSPVDYLLMGRAIDMIRIMRFFPIFRDVVRRSSDVLPALSGPLILVLTMVHIFVYFGMALWAGAIDPKVFATNMNLDPLYYLNNFNSYPQGLVTVFNILVVNDWHAIAQVFLYASRCSSPWIVYPFFISALCIGVFIMVNVVTAFFVESFVTKLGGPAAEAHGEHGHPNPRDDFSIRTAENSSVRRMSNIHNLRGIAEPPEDEPAYRDREDSRSIYSSASTLVFNFDVYEREGFDQIMKAVAGVGDEQEAFAQTVCDCLEIFEALTVGREKVGYMVCCQQSMNRFGNRRFKQFATDFLPEDVLHRVVGDMHSEILVLSSRKNFEGRSLVRTFKSTRNSSFQLEICGTLLRHQPAVSLLVSRIKSVDKPKS